jgi:hypothetical protein
MNNKGLGKDQKQMLAFFQRYRSHYNDINTDKTTKRIAMSLEKRRLLTIDKTHRNWFCRIKQETREEK